MLTELPVNQEVLVRTRRFLAVTVALATPTAAVLVPAGPATAAPTPSVVWERNIAGGTFVESSPTVANLDGQNDIVVGNHNGNVYAVKGTDGNDVAGWPRQLGDAIDSSPAAANVDGNGSPEVFIGSGVSNAFTGNNWGLNANGTIRWNYNTVDSFDASHAIFSSPALGDVNADGLPDSSGFTLGLRAWSFTATSGAINSGWPAIQDDSTFSSPALADIDGDGKTDYVVGGDSAAGGVVDNRGGLVRALRGDGSVIWQFFTNEAVRSSPVVADIDGNGQPEIVFGTGNYWANNGGASDSTRVFALNRNGSLKWVRELGAQTLAAPAVADIDGNGTLDVIEGTWAGDNAARGRVTAFNGNGDVITNWNRKSSGAGDVIGQVSTADFDNDGAQDVLVPASLGAIAYSGRSGVELFRLNYGQVSYQNSPWIGDLDGNGRLDIVMAGTKSGTQGVLTRYQFGDTGPRLGTNNYSQFRKDARHTGSWTNPPLAVNRCADYPGQGYHLSADDGGIFSFCVPNFGSVGGQRLNAPVVGMASRPNRTGYWEVASDGGVFAFGAAPFVGSAGALPLNQPIVGMASTPSGNGYWLVARDGGIFSYGDARFYGSTGSIRLNQPIVGMASTPSGNGYWLVARDGGIFSFGDAKFFGSTGSLVLNQPVVGMAATANGNGYWLAAADGGIFAFGNAPFLGSTGSIRLTQPVVGISRSEGGAGYRMVARDGGIFTYGDAGFVGSTATYRLNAPVNGIG